MMPLSASNVVRCALVAALVGCSAEPQPTDSDVLDGCPVLGVDLDVLVFQPVSVDESATLELLVFNDCEPGRNFLVVDAWLEGDGAFRLVDDSVTVEPAMSGAVQLQFTPTRGGPHEATVRLVPHDGLDEVTVVVRGEGVDTASWDLDGDGFDSVAHGGRDCDDNDPTVHPGATERWYDGVDQDCSGGSDYDQDGDGFDAEPWAGDCDDADPSVHPGAEELPNGVDDDCNGLVDDGELPEGTVFISEFLNRPLSSGDAVGEWFEIANIGPADLDLMGWTVQHGSSLVLNIDEPLLLRAGGVVVLGTDSDPDRNGGYAPDFVYDQGTFPLHDTTGSFALYRGADLVYRLRYSSLEQVGGAANQLDGDYWDGPSAADPANWCASITPMSGGDRGTPGAINPVCLGDVPDGDGDGWLIEDGDCDDADPTVNPGETEVWADRKDNDCSGLVDDLPIDDVYSGYLDGRAAGTTVKTPDYLSFKGNLSKGDIDDDGLDEILLGSWYGAEYSGVVYGVEADDFASYSGQARLNSDTIVKGASTYNYIGSMGREQVDLDGDSVPDLALGGHDYWDAEKGNVAFALFLGSTAMWADISPDDAYLTGSGSSTSAEAAFASHLDFDGDGLAELLHGEAIPFHDASSSTNYDGVVRLLDPYGLTGDVSLDDADTVFTGGTADLHLGSTVGGGDLDGDGRDDLLLGADGDSTYATESGVIYGIFGDTSLPSSGTIDKAYDFALYGQRLLHRFGDGVEPRVADFDGDGNVDLVVSSHERSQVFFFSDVSGWSGSYTTADADITFGADSAITHYGLGLAQGDWDGDGVTDLAVGAPDDDSYIPSSFATHEGAVYIYFVSDYTGSSVRYDEAHATLAGMGITDAFGATLLGADLDADGDDELVIGANGHTKHAGRVYFVDF